MRKIAWLLCASALAGLGCSDSEDGGTRYPYMPGETTIIGGGDGTSGGTDGTAGTTGNGGAGEDIEVGNISTGIPVSDVVSTPSGGQCLDQLDEVCVQPQNVCGDDATADVIVGENGEVLSTICYPNKDYEVIDLGTAPVSNPELGNNTVIVLDGENDGVDVEGDLSIVGNNVIVYGEGPDNSVIGGNLSIDKNNAIVRGVRIQGDVTISKNNASLIYCVIEGDLTITGNNVNLALCEVWGDVTIEGLNTVFVSNLVLGDQPIEGDNLNCNDNYRFEDADGDGDAADDEVVAPVVCISREVEVTDDPDLMPGNAP